MQTLFWAVGLIATVHCNSEHFSRTALRPPLKMTAAELSSLSVSREPYGVTTTALNVRPHFSDSLRCSFTLSGEEPFLGIGAF